MHHHQPCSHAEANSIRQQLHVLAVQCCPGSALRTDCCGKGTNALTTQAQTVPPSMPTIAGRYRYATMQQHSGMSTRRRQMLPVTQGPGSGDLLFKLSLVQKIASSPELSPEAQGSAGESPQLNVSRMRRFLVLSSASSAARRPALMASRLKSCCRQPLLIRC